MAVKDNLKSILNQLPESVKLVAVSKTKSIQEISEAYNHGQKYFGENRVSELIEKEKNLPKDIEWHMIGHLQSKKTKLIAQFIDYIHSVDSIKLLITINKEAKRHNRIINCLLQLHIAQETNKHGFSKEEIVSILNSNEYKSLDNIRIKGLMGMATFTTNKKQIKDEFKNLANFFNLIKINHNLDPIIFNQISMGMSGDYKIAIEEGSTMVRIGSNIFGARKKN